MKISTYLKIFVMPSVIIGSIGQIIWAFIYQNNEAMFMHHWTVGLVAMAWTLIGGMIMIYKLK